jgi:leucyl aminopeptidase
VRFSRISTRAIFAARRAVMKVGTDREPAENAVADVLAVPFAGASTGVLGRLDALSRGRLALLAADASVEPGSLAVINLSAEDGISAARVALAGVGSQGAIDAAAVRTAAAAASRAAGRFGGTVAWAFDDELPLDAEAQARAVVEGAVIGSYDAGARKSERREAGVERLTVVGAPGGIDDVVKRAEVVARWTNRARGLVDGPPNEVTPDGMAVAARELLEPAGVSVDVLALDEIEELGLSALAAVGRGSVNDARLIVLRSGDGDPSLALVGKSVTFDSGGYFLKSQGDIVRQKADMGGGAAVFGAMGAIAELGLRLPVLGVLPAAENMIDGAAFRPGDILTTAAGLTVEVTNPDAEGRLLLADALWFARREGARRLVDVATLTGAARGALGDRYIAVFANDDTWREQVVAAGDASGDFAWPMPLHPRYGRLLESSLADLRNTSGRSFGYPIFAAAFLERFVDGLPWAHLDIHSTAYLDDERDEFTRGATGAGVRLLVELASRLESDPAERTEGLSVEKDQPVR